MTLSFRSVLVSFSLFGCTVTPGSDPGDPSVPGSGSGDGDGDWGPSGSGGDGDGDSTWGGPGDGDSSVPILTPPDWTPPEFPESDAAPGSTEVISRLRDLVSCPDLEQESALQPGNAWGGDEGFFVIAPGGNDANPGTEDEPWATLQHAANNLSPGQTVLIKDGVYGDSTADNVTFTFDGVNRSWNGYHTNIRSQGQPGRYITFRNYPGHRPIFDVRSINGIQLDGASYVEMSGFEVRGIDDIPQSSIDHRNESHIGNGISMINGAHHVKIRNMIVHHVGGNGIALGGGGEVTASCNVLYHTSHRSQAGNSGISVGIEYEYPHMDSEGYGFVVTNNVCFDVENTFPFTESEEGLITDGNCIIFDVMTRTGYPRRSLASNNLAFYNGGRGVHVYKSSHVDILHNTSYMNLRSGDVYDALGAEISAITASDVLMQGNIAVPRDDGLAYVFHAADNVTLIDNLGFGGGKYQFGTITYTEGDPQFAAPGVDPMTVDFRIAPSSPGAAAGVSSLPDLARLTFDLVGADRSMTSARDLGAYEVAE